MATLHLLCGIHSLTALECHMSERLSPMASRHSTSTERFLQSVGVREDRVTGVSSCLDRLFVSCGVAALTGAVLGWRRVRRTYSTNEMSLGFGISLLSCVV